MSTLSCLWEYPDICKYLSTDMCTLGDNSIGIVLSMNLCQPYWKR